MISSSIPSAGIPRLNGMSSASSQPGLLATPRTRMMSGAGGWALRMISTLLMCSTGALAAACSSAPAGEFAGCCAPYCPLPASFPCSRFCASAAEVRTAVISKAFSGVLIDLSRNLKSRTHRPPDAARPIQRPLREFAWVCVREAPLQPPRRVQNQIDRNLLREITERRAPAREATILEQLIHRRAAAADREVFAAPPAGLDAGRDIARHGAQRIARAHFLERCGVHIADDEIVILRVPKPEKLRRECGDIAFAIDVHHAERFDLNVSEALTFGTKYARQHTVDLADETDAAPFPGQPPERAQEAPKAGL